MTPDFKIWEVLEKCHIKEEVETAGGLDIIVKENGTSFSVGQRQLICLARAIIKSSKVYHPFKTIKYQILRLSYQYYVKHQCPIFLDLDTN